MVDSVPTPTITSENAYMTTTTVAKASVQAGKRKASAPMDKKKGEKQEKPIQEPPEVVAIEYDVELDAEVVIDEQAEGSSEQSAGTGQAVQSTSANTSATQIDGDAQIPIEVELGAEHNEVAMETSMSKQEELGMAVMSTPTPSPHHT